jgi:maleate cis-trans isomerase
MSKHVKIHFGLLSPASADRPHFRSLERMLPGEISLSHEGLGLLRNSYRNLEGKTGEITARATEFVQRSKVQGLIITGGFVTLFNPGLEDNIAAAVRIPVASAISSVIAALHALSAQSLILITPFSSEMNSVIKDHLTGRGFTVFTNRSLGENRAPGASSEISADELFDHVVDAHRRNPSAEAIYFQGATLDPLPIIQKVEDKLGTPVIASNPAMIWNLASKLELKFSLPGYGQLLSSWPAHNH